jgi:hypothetical protein
MTPSGQGELYARRSKRSKPQVLSTFLLNGCLLSLGQTERTFDTKKLRSWWFHRQGLDGRLRGESAAKVLSETGWARSVGGAAPYLTLFSRNRLSREAADAAAAGLEIHELPAARGCTYVVPACDFALALKAASGFGDSELKVAYKLGVTDKEIGKLCEAVNGWKLSESRNRRNTLW